MKNLLSSWKCRYLSIKGKVTVINSLAISPLLYLASVIHVLCRVIQEVKQIVTDFIWNGKPPKVAYNVMIQNIENGGMKLVDWKSKVISLKVGFIKCLLQNKDGKWRATSSHFFQTNNLNSFFNLNDISPGSSHPSIQRGVMPLTDDLPTTAPSPLTFEFWKLFPTLSYCLWLYCQ